MSALPLVEFVGVTKSYGGLLTVIHDLNLAVQKGEFLTLLGPSGSGKTTSLMMLAGFEAPTRGEIRIAGRPVQDIPPHRRNIGMVFQNYALFPHMTVAENLAYPLRVRRVPKPDMKARVARSLEMVQMQRFADRKPAQLSGGQQQRVALARALVFGPELVLMDEPLGALDKSLRETLQYEIKHLHERLGVTVVYVTHDQGEALTMSDRIAVFNHGRIEQLAAPAKLYESPANAFVAGFIGENNALPGIVRDAQAERCTVDLSCGSVSARTGPGVGLGSSVVVSIRPERLRLASAPDLSENRLRATVSNVTYLGDHLRAHMVVGGDQALIAKLPNMMGLPPLAAGEHLDISWRCEDGLALLAEGSFPGQMTHAGHAARYPAPATQKQDVQQ